jgi:hypothetical protein
VRFILRNWKPNLSEEPDYEDECPGSPSDDLLDKIPDPPKTSREPAPCESACNKDPVFEVIGIQSGPGRPRPDHLAQDLPRHPKLAANRPYQLPLGEIRSPDLPVPGDG